MKKDSFVIWDFYFENKVLLSRLDRYSCSSAIEGTFYADKCPPGHQPLGGGVVFVKNLDQLEKDPPEIDRPVKAGKDGFMRPDLRHDGTLSLFALLPSGYAIPDLDGIFPMPIAFKVIDQRLAIYWRVQADQRDFYWKLVSLRPEKLEEHYAKLNRERHRRKNATSHNGPSGSERLGQISAEKIWEIIYEAVDRRGEDEGQRFRDHIENLGTRKSHALKRLVEIMERAEEGLDQTERGGPKPRTFVIEALARRAMKNSEVLEAIVGLVPNRKDAEWPSQIAPLRDPVFICVKCTAINNPVWSESKPNPPQYCEACGLTLPTVMKPDERPRSVLQCPKCKIKFSLDSSACRNPYRKLEMCPKECGWRLKAVAVELGVSQEFTDAQTQNAVFERNTRPQRDMPQRDS